MERNQQHHFVLVHGGCHGAWCWYKVITTLRSNGHRVTPLDMAAAGVNPKLLDDLTSFSHYCQPLIDFMASLPPHEKVVLVAHGMGGLCISLAMETFPHKIALAVFVAAFLPGPDSAVLALYAELFKNADSYMDSEHFYSNGFDNPPTSLLFGDQFMASKLYQLSPPEDLTLATLLVRPVGLFFNQFEDFTVSKEKYGSVRLSYIICDKDNAMKRDYQELLLQKNPVDEVKIIPGADHMIMFSKSQELCSCLQDLANKY